MQRAILCRERHQHDRQAKDRRHVVATREVLDLLPQPGPDLQRDQAVGSRRDASKHAAHKEVRAVRARVHPNALHCAAHHLRGEAAQPSDRHQPDQAFGRDLERRVPDSEHADREREHDERPVRKLDAFHHHQDHTHRRYAEEQQQVEGLEVGLFGRGREFVRVAQESPGT